MYKNFTIPYLYEAQHVSGDTPPIIRSLKLQWYPLFFHKWKVVGRPPMQQCIKILLFQIYMKLNMFRATHRPSSGA
jgi:hypothetical protein